MTLTTTQFEQFVENYVSHLMDGMDTETMEVIVSDLLFHEYETHTEEQIVNEITEIYGADMVAELVPVPVA